MSDAQHATAPTSVEPPLDADSMARIAKEILEGRADFASALGVTSEQLEAIYALGHGLYENGRYGDAEDVFRFLSLHRHLDPRFWLGLGASQQMQKKVALAVQAYSMGAMVAPTDPQMSLRAAECLVSLGQKDAARTALEAALLAAEDDPAKQPYARRARMILDNLNGKGA